MHVLIDYDLYGVGVRRNGCCGKGLSVNVMCRLIVWFLFGWKIINSLSVELSVRLARVQFVFEVVISFLFLE